MGLGKTIQTIALLAHLMEFKQNKGPHLIVGPKVLFPIDSISCDFKAVLHNWGREFCNWTPDMKVVTYDGTAEERRLIRNERLRKQNFNVVLTHYDLIIRDKSAFKKARDPKLRNPKIFCRFDGSI